MAVLSQQIGTEPVDRLNAGSTAECALAPQVAIRRVPGRRLCEQPHNAAFQLSGRRAGVRDDKKAVDISSLKEISH